MRDDSRRGGPTGGRRVDVQALARTIDDDVIPRLALRHRQEAAPAEPNPRAPAARSGEALPGEREVRAYTKLVLDGADAQAASMLDALRARGCPVETIFLHLLQPAARLLGELWCDDRIDFAQCTLAVGRMQRVMRELSQAFAAECEPAARAHRALFVQASGEQHGFGLSMLAEFFRRAGWDVVGAVGAAAGEAAERVRREWIDVVGFSVGSEVQLDRLRSAIAGVRAASQNPRVVVMLGGPLFVERPELLAACGADGGAVDANQALLQAARLVAERNASH